MSEPFSVSLVESTGFTLEIVVRAGDKLVARSEAEYHNLHGALLGLIKLGNELAVRITADALGSITGVPSDWKPARPKDASSSAAVTGEDQ